MSLLSWSVWDPLRKEYTTPGHIDRRESAPGRAKHKSLHTQQKPSLSRPRSVTSLAPWAGNPPPPRAEGAKTEAKTPPRHTSCPCPGAPIQGKFPSFFCYQRNVGQPRKTRKERTMQIAESGAHFFGRYNCLVAHSCSLACIGAQLEGMSAIDVAPGCGKWLPPPQQQGKAVKVGWWGRLCGYF